MHLIARDLEFRYPGRTIFDGLSLRVSQGARLALVGENGSGKTTLLRVLAGELVPQGGTTTLDGSFSYVPQELEVVGTGTIGDEVAQSLASLRAAVAELERAAEQFNHETGSLAQYSEVLARIEALEAWDAERRVDEALTRLGAIREYSRPMAQLSVGERYRVRLACTLAERRDILLLDEPTNHLDEQAIGYLTQVMKTWHGAVVVVTHDRMLLDDVATAILDLDPSMDGKPVLYGQPGYMSYRFAKSEAWRRWNQRYRAERKRAIALEHRLDQSYEGLSDEWRPPKGSQKHRRGTRARIHVKAADRLVEKLKAEAVDIPPPPPVLNFPDLPTMNPGWDPGSPIIDVRNIAVEGNGRTRLDLPAQRLTVAPASRLLITGANGTGKSTLMRVLAGTLEPTRGYRTALGDARIGVVTQESNIGRLVRPDENPSCFDLYARLALELLQSGKLDPNNVVPVAYLGLLSEETLDRPIRELSVGQRKRFELACALLAMPNVLLLDEPTNHLSIDLVDDLTQALMKTSAAVIVATHDRRMRADFEDWPELVLK
ncbi:ABC-F family ATP-binding cassette domain-containing protein [Timonella senegalensis]|uniref:ABC-F family ATP-binding cassette domain-containing protein n=1 Tax=Timonella senegalensis TaxID=1465825 RepID=UPI00030C0AF9|nr:ABC-F family ATP-binding cassette domain-containing protein [Timonella senegalensis]